MEVITPKCLNCAIIIELYTQILMIGNIFLKFYNNWHFCAFWSW